MPILLQVPRSGLSQDLSSKVLSSKVLVLSLLKGLDSKTGVCTRYDLEDPDSTAAH